MFTRLWIVRKSFDLRVLSLIDILYSVLLYNTCRVSCSVRRLSCLLCTGWCLIIFVLYSRITYWCKASCSYKSHWSCQTQIAPTTRERNYMFSYLNNASFLRNPFARNPSSLDLPTTIRLMFRLARKHYSSEHLLKSIMSVIKCALLVMLPALQPYNVIWMLLYFSSIFISCIIRHKSVIDMIVINIYLLIMYIIVFTLKQKKTYFN